MEESILEAAVIGFLPDRVVVRRSDGGGMDTRCYVPQDLYEDVDAANRAWQEENRKLRELVRSFYSAMLFMLETGLWATDPKWLEQRMRELGIEVGA